MFTADDFPVHDNDIDGEAFDDGTSHNSPKQGLLMPEPSPADSGDTHNGDDADGEHQQPPQIDTTSSTVTAKPTTTATNKPTHNVKTTKPVGGGGGTTSPLKQQQPQQNQSQQQQLLQQLLRRENAASAVTNSPSPVSSPQQIHRSPAARPQGAANVSGGTYGSGVTGRQGGLVAASSNYYYPVTVVNSALSVISREELESRLIDVKDDNTTLKKSLRAQEERIKQLTAKLIHVTDDSRKPGRERKLDNLEMEIDDLRANLLASTKQNEALKNKLQLERLTKPRSKLNRNGAYHYITSRVDTGRPPHPSAPRPMGRASNAKTLIPLMTGPSPSPPRPATQPLFMINMNDALTNVPRQSPEENDFRTQTSESEPCSSDDNDTKKHSQYAAEKVTPERLIELLKGNPGYDLENIDAHSLHDALRHLVQQYTGNGTADLDQVKYKEEIQRLQSMLISAQEEVKTTQDLLQKKQKTFTDDMQALQQAQNDITELTAQNRTLQSNNEFLKKSLEAVKDAHTKLMSQFNEVNGSLLEEKTKSRINEAQTKERIRNQETSSQELHQIIEQLKEEKAQLQDIVNKHLHTGTQKDSAIDEERTHLLSRISQLEERLSHTGQSATNFVNQQCDTLTGNLTSLSKEMQELRERNKDLVAELSIAQSQLEASQNKLKEIADQSSTSAQHEETKRELERSQIDCQQLAQDLQTSRTLLELQQSLNLKLKKEVEQPASMVNENSLESKKDSVPQVITDQSQLNLKPTENALEITIIAVDFSAASAAFLVLDFFEHQTVITPLLCAGAKPNFTICFKTQVDQFFLYYLKSSSVLMELYSYMGGSFSLTGLSSLSFSALVDEGISSKAISSRADFISANDKRSMIGSVNFSVRMVHSMADQIRSIPTGEMTQFGGGTAGILQKNVLVVQVLSCQSLPNTIAGPPSTFVHYQLFKFPDSLTEVIPRASNPKFNHEEKFCLMVTDQLEHYFLTENIEFTVIDDQDPHGDAYLGIAIVPLSPLATGHSQENSFPLKSIDGHTCGNIDVNIHWMYPWESQVDAQENFPIKEQSRSDQERLAITTATSTAKITAVTHPRQQQQHVIDKKKQQLLKFVGVSIVITVSKLEYIPTPSSARATSTPAYDTSADKVAVTVHFLRVDSDIITQWRPLSDGPIFNFSFRKEYPLDDPGNRFKLMTIMSSHVKSDADIVFNLCLLSPSSKVKVIGSGEVNLHDIVGTGADLEDLDIVLSDINSVPVAHLWVSVSALDALSSLPNTH